ncbi:MAG: hypothetical protein JHC93_06170 [Parachlamydiales bacterium]|nr:hypothetical protein [Parachlamydiales bacterium]
MDNVASTNSRSSSRIAIHPVTDNILEGGLQGRVVTSPSTFDRCAIKIEKAILVGIFILGAGTTAFGFKDSNPLIIIGGIYFMTVATKLNQIQHLYF